MTEFEIFFGKAQLGSWYCTFQKKHVSATTPSGNLYKPWAELKVNEKPLVLPAQQLTMCFNVFQENGTAQRFAARSVE